MKATALAHSNTALIKYWGKKDEQLIIPMNNSISITIDALSTITTVEFSPQYTEDVFILNDNKATGRAYQRVVKHLDLLRQEAQRKLKAKVVSKNNFPTAMGLASSASGFAALTVAACAALGLKKTPQELSMLSRQGSGSSCRSIFGGFVEWVKDDGTGKSYAIQLANEDWWDLRDIVLILEEKEQRQYSTREAMRLSMKTSPFFAARLAATESNLDKMRRAIKKRDFTLLGTVAEHDCLLMHAVALTSNPWQLFWTSATVKMMKLVPQLREKGLPCYFTIDSGANMHLLTLPEHQESILAELEKHHFIKKIVCARLAGGATIISDHLF